MKPKVKITVAGLAILNASLYASTALAGPPPVPAKQDSVYGFVNFGKGKYKCVDCFPWTPSQNRVYNWSGVYFGGYGGGTWQSVHYNSATLNGSAKAASLNGGGVIGYNYQFLPMWVFGLEGDFGFLNPQNTTRINNIDISTKSNWEGEISARIGAVINEHWLAYIKSGVGFTRQTVSLRNIVTDGFASNSYTHTGLVVGGGVEYAFPNSSWSLQVEYTHSFYKSHTFIFGDPFANEDLPTKLAGDKIQAKLVTHVKKWH